MEKKTIIKLIILLLPVMLLSQEYETIQTKMDSLEWIINRGDDSNITPGQKIDWIVTDRNYGRHFLRSYLDVLTQMDPMANLQIQETDEVRVGAIMQDNGSTILNTVHAKSRVGALNELSKAVLLNMDVHEIRRLLARRYEWDYISKLEVGFLTGNIINVFQERNYKQCRDAFWWTHRRVDFGFFPRMFFRINPKYAINLEFGREEIGFPISASRTLNLGLTTEVFKFYLTVPSVYPGISDGHPLDGAYGGGMKFDSPRLGGSLSYQDMGLVSKGDITYFDPEHIIYNNYSGQVYWSFTNRIGKAEDEPGLGLPLGSLRIMIGVTFFSLVYGYENSDLEFEILDQTEKMLSMQGLLRAEYATDMDERFINKWRFGTQINLGLTGFGSVQFSLTRTFLEWFSASIAGNYYWTGIEYQDGRLGEDGVYFWEPGWFFTPSISIYF